MDFLDQMLAEAAAEVRKAKSRPKGSPVRPVTENRENLYLPFRLVALFHRTTCAHCGTVTREFEGLFEERKHVRVGDLHLVRQPFVPLDSTLPRVKKYLPRDVPYCIECTDLDSYQEE